MIDWDAIRRKGASAELTADTHDALCAMAAYAEPCNQPPFCELCDGGGKHADDCPIAVLERVEGTDGA